MTTDHEGGFTTSCFIGHKFSGCDCEVPASLVSDHDALLARIKQAQKHYCEIYVGGNNDCSTEGTDPCYSCQIHSALRAVVELKEIEIIPADSNYLGHYQKGKENGYNQALADMKQAIEKELG